MEASDLSRIPAETLVDTIMHSHRILARVHEEEIQDVQARLREIVAATQTIQGFSAEIQKTIKAVEAVTEKQAKLVDAWSGRHQDFLETFDKQAATFMKQSTESYAGILEAKAQSLNTEISKKLKPVLDQLAASLQMEVDALGKKVSENSHNAIHDLDALNSAVRRHTKNWQDQTVKLYGRILAFSVLGAFAGTIVALFISRFVH
jgi:FtsZ-binding cell division protein ZapB